MDGATMSLVHSVCRRENMERKDLKRLFLSFAARGRIYSRHRAGKVDPIFYFLLIFLSLGKKI